MIASGPWKNPLCVQCGLKRAAGLPGRDGQGDRPSERQSAADRRLRPRPAGFSGWPALIVALFRRLDLGLQKRVSIASQPDSLKARRFFQPPAGWGTPLPAGAMGAGLMALLLAAMTAGAHARDDEPASPRQLLTRMVSAYENRSFSGRFLYMLSGEVSTLALQRAVIDGEVYERLIHLQGRPTEVIRNNGRTVSVQPDESVTLLSSSTGIGPLRLEDSAAPEIPEQYRARLSGSDRVAGRPCWQLRLEPRDQHRYGYRLWLDHESGLLLKSEVVNGEHQALERVEFISLNLDPELEPAQFSLPESVGSPASTAAVSGAVPRVRPGWLPPGFTPAARERHELQGRTGVVNSMTYSDGLTAFTLFVETAPPDATPPAPRRRGPTVVLARMLQAGDQHYRTTLVGEIPPATGRRILNGVALESSRD